jgi:hypothetical protein
MVEEKPEGRLSEGLSEKPVPLPDAWRRYGRRHRAPPYGFMYVC